MTRSTQSKHVLGFGELVPLENSSVRPEDDRARCETAQEKEQAVDLTAITAWSRIGPRR